MNNSQVAQSIKRLAVEKRVSVSKVLNDCQIRKSLIYDLEKRDYTPSAEILEKIADYFGVSIDFLLGKTDVRDFKAESSPALIDGEALDEYLIRRLCSLSPDELALVDAFVQGLLANRKE